MISHSKNIAWFHSISKNAKGKTIFGSLILYIIIALTITSCDLTGPSQAYHSLIKLSTNSNRYTVQDTIQVTLANDSTSNIHFLKDCGPTFNGYQQWINKHWSKPKNIIPPTWECAAYPDTLKPGDEISDTMLAKSFETVGTFRLVFSYYDMSHYETTYSNNFTVLIR